jgi:hypothetical protein
LKSTSYPIQQISPPPPPIHRTTSRQQIKHVYTHYSDRLVPIYVAYYRIMRCDHHRRRSMEIGYRCGVRIYLRVVYQSLWITVSRMMWDTLYPNMHIQTTLDLDFNHDHRKQLFDHLTPVLPTDLQSIVSDYSFSVRRDQEFSTPDFNGFICQNILLSELEHSESIQCRVTLDLLHCGCACSLALHPRRRV